MVIASVAAIVAFSPAAHAGPQATVSITTYPSIALADGKSIVNITVKVLDRGGSFVPDATQVVLSTSLGQLREARVMTTAGVARAVLVAPNIVGAAKVSASVPAYGAIGEVEVQFTDDRRAVSAGEDYIEVSGPTYLAYFADMRWLAATGKNRTAIVRYRDIEIRATDLQVDLTQERVIAKRASLKIGKTTHYCEELSYRLRQRRGFAVMPFDGRVQVASIVGERVSSAPSGYQENEFQFVDNLADSTSYVTASWVTVFPNQKIQFHRATIYATGTKVMSLPLYSMDMWGGGQLFGTNLVGVNDGRLSLDVPFYYALSPRSTGNFRLRTQQRSSLGYGASHGLFLDLEQSYSASDRYQGGLVVSSITSEEWGANWRHHQKFDSDLQGFFMLDMPEHRALFGSGSLSRSFNGFTAGLNFSAQRQFSGFDPQTQRADLFVETNPLRLKGTPISQTWSLTASYSEFGRPDGTKDQNNGTGVRWRMLTDPIRIGGLGSVVSGLSLSQLAGTSGANGFGIVGTLAGMFPLPKLGMLTLTYDYADEGLTSSSLGKQRVTGQMFANWRGFQFSVFGASALDADYLSFQTDLSYRFASAFRMGLGYAAQEFSGFKFDDYSIILGYRLGYREIALTWSKQTNRLGIELLAAEF